MTVVFDKGATFLGLPVKKLRDVLYAWRYSSAAGGCEIGLLKKVNLDPRTVAGFLGEAEDRGLIGEEAGNFGRKHYGLTEAGQAVVSGKARKRTPRAAAQKALDGFLSACAAMNANPACPQMVSEVWLYGSMLDGERVDVGDIDLVCVYDRKPDYDDLQVYDDKLLDLVEELGGYHTVAAKGSLFLEMNAEVWVRRQLLFGGRRNPLFALSDVGQMANLACSCRRIFTASAGAVDEPVLDRHPSSTGRGDNVRDPRQMPDLKALRAPIEVTHVNHLFGHRLSNEARSAMIDPTEYATSVRSHWVLGNVFPRPGKSTRSYGAAAIDLSGLDGKRSSALMTDEIDGDFRDGHGLVSAVVFNRQVEETTDEIVYEFEIAQASFGRFGGEQAYLQTVTFWLRMLIETDIERFMRRAREADEPKPVKVRLKWPEDALCKLICNEISECMTRAFLLARKRVDDTWAPEPDRELEAGLAPRM